MLQGRKRARAANRRGRSGEFSASTAPIRLPDEDTFFFCWPSFASSPLCFSSWHARLSIALSTVRRVARRMVRLRASH